MKKPPTIFKKNVPRLKVAVLYSGLPCSADSSEIASEIDTIETAQEVALTLNNLGYKVSFRKVQEDNIESLISGKEDIYFNLCENGVDYLVAEFLERGTKYFTGSPVKTLKLTTNKAKTKELLLENQLSTPKHYLYERADEVVPDGFNFPVIVKPVSEDASIGLSQNSVVTDYEELAEQVKLITTRYQQAALAEEFINGRELLVTVVGMNGDAKVLPFAEVVFGPHFENRFTLQTYDAKWDADSPDYKDSPLKCPIENLPSSVSKRVEEMCLRAFHLTGCRGYARIDLRLDENLKPYILEVNANPSLSNTEDSPVIMAHAAEGFTYPQLIDKITKLALTI